MKYQVMLKKEVAKRRGAVTNETGGYSCLLIKCDPDEILDKLTKSGVIGAAKRDCTKEILADGIVRPMGEYGLLVRLKGQKWTYLVSSSIYHQWPAEWAKKFKWETAFFRIDGMLSTKIARCFKQSSTYFDFVCGLVKSERGYLFRKKIGDESAILKGESKQCTKGWLFKLESGGAGIDLLAREIDAYVPIGLYGKDQNGRVKAVGGDGFAHADSDEEYQEFQPRDFQRVDLFSMNGLATLEPNPQSQELTKAINHADAELLKKALKNGADPNLMSDNDETPLISVIQLRGNQHYGNESLISWEKQIELMGALLKAGANPDSPGHNSAIHEVFQFNDEGDEAFVIRQIKLLLDYGADPNKLGAGQFTFGQSPLHIAVVRQQWIAVAKYLLSRGASVKTKNESGQTPLQWLDKNIEIFRKLNHRKIESEDADIFAKANARSRHQILMNMQKSRLNEDIGNRDKLIRMLILRSYLKSCEGKKPDCNGIEELGEISASNYAEKKRRWTYKQKQLKDRFPDMFK